MEPEQNIYKQLKQLSNYKLVDISESDTNISMEETQFKDKSSYIHEMLHFIANNLSEKLKIIVKNFSSTVLDELFEMLIKIWIQKNREKVRVYFLSLNQIYDVFYANGFRIISSNTIEELTGALQWDIISPDWVNYNFLFDYYKKLSSMVTKDLKNKTWILVELTRIKKQELAYKFSQQKNLTFIL